MIYFKACPRCQGDIHITGDWYGEFAECLQCGYEADVNGGTENIWDPQAVQEVAEEVLAEVA